MNHVKMRRLALVAASVSISSFLCLLLVGATIEDFFPKVSAHGFFGKESEKQRAISEAQMEPIVISCTPLEIQGIVSYDGKFTEDGTDREVQDVAAIMLYNTRDEIVPYAFVTVYTENCRYTFHAYMIPAKSCVLVPEETAQKLTETDILRVFGWTTVSREKKKIRLDIEEIEMNCLCVTNRSGSKVKDLTIYYRTHISEGDFYMGGKAFQTKIKYIAPGESILINLPNYAAGYSKVVFYE